MTNFEMYHIMVKASSLNRVKLQKVTQFLESTGDLEFLSVGNVMKTVATEEESLKDATYSELIALEGTLDSNGQLRVNVCEWVQITVLCRPSCWESIKAMKLW